MHYTALKVCVTIFVSTFIVVGANNIIKGAQENSTFLLIHGAMFVIIPFFVWLQFMKTFSTAQDYIKNLKPLSHKNKIAPTNHKEYFFKLKKLTESGEFIIHDGVVYATGLATTQLEAHDILDCVYSDENGMEIWSRQKGEPVWRLSKAGLGFKPGRSDRESLRAFLLGIDADGKPPKSRQIEFVFQKIAGEAAAYNAMNAFHAWIEEITASSQTNEEDSAEWIGKREAGDRGERLVREQVKRQLGGTYVDGFIPTENMVWRGQNFEIDLLCLCSCIGLVLMEIKNFAGEVRFRGEECLQIKSSGEEYRPDVSPIRQALRAQGILESLLREHGLDYPVIPLVVMANPDMGLAVEPPDSRCAVVKLEDLPAWFDRLTHNSAIEFSEDNFKSIRATLKSVERQYLK